MCRLGQSAQDFKPLFMKITFLVVGKTTDKSLTTLIEEYQKRLKFYTTFELVCIPDLKNTKNISAAEQKEKEGELILKQLTQTDTVVLCDEKGKQYRSIEFADFIEKKLLTSCKNIVFIVGGAYGFSNAVYKRANSMFSMSKMTFSHQMIRLLFVEQLYRAMTILKGEPYHHE